MSRRNPRIKETEIGITEIRQIKIYPLSLAGEQCLYDMVEDVKEHLKEMAGTDDNWQENIQLIELVDYAIKFISKNLETILEFVTNGEDVKELINEIDNVQVVEIAKIIYFTNFDEVKKKVVTLVEMLAMGQETLQEKGKETPKKTE